MFFYRNYLLNVPSVEDLAFFEQQGYFYRGWSLTTSPASTEPLRIESKKEIWCLSGRPIGNEFIYWILNVLYLLFAWYYVAIFVLVVSIVTIFMLGVCEVAQLKKSPVADKRSHPKRSPLSRSDFELILFFNFPRWKKNNKKNNHRSTMLLLVIFTISLSRIM